MVTASLHSEPRTRTKGGGRPAEAWMWGVIFALFLFDVSLFVVQGNADAILAFVVTKLLVAPFIALGLVCRYFKRDETIVTTMLMMTAFALFTHVVTLANHAFLPLSRPLIDTTLAAWDAALGFHWPSVLAFAAEYPTTTLVGRYIYNSSIVQAAVTLFVLGLGGWTLRMERFVLCSSLAAIVTISFWIVFPSFGPTTIYTVSSETVDIVAPVAGPEYGKHLLELAVKPNEGLARIETVGLIAFPSYHTVMAILVPLALWPVRWLRWPALLVNAAMMPFIVVHGGHYVIDLMGGAVVALASWWFAGRLVHGWPRQSANNSLEVGSRPSAA